VERPSRRPPSVRGHLPLRPVSLFAHEAGWPFAAGRHFQHDQAVHRRPAGAAWQEEELHAEAVGQAVLPVEGRPGIASLPQPVGIDQPGCFLLGFCKVARMKASSCGATGSGLSTGAVAATLSKRCPRRRRGGESHSRPSTRSRAKHPGVRSRFAQVVEQLRVTGAGILKHVGQQRGAAEVTRLVQFRGEGDRGAAVPTRDSGVEGHEMEGVTSDVAQQEAMVSLLLRKRSLPRLWPGALAAADAGTISGQNPNPATTPPSVAPGWRCPPQRIRACPNRDFERTDAGGRGSARASVSVRPTGRLPPVHPATGV
jgi:hypothetical protein